MRFKPNQGWPEGLDQARRGRRGPTSTIKQLDADGALDDDRSA
jgi:hypothetical protein